ncbi:hypothetical protein AB0M54_24095 [Actinoplanes sp. NPDC051470]|uniref:hypothetical protein n=1 Tax=unclassified Actinoplanes TaxID=2626549 RepID=UPI00341ECB43
MDHFKLIASALVSVATFILLRTFRAPTTAALILAVAAGAVAATVLYLMSRRERGRT